MKDSKYTPDTAQYILYKNVNLTLISVTQCQSHVFKSKSRPSSVHYQALLALKQQLRSGRSGTSRILPKSVFSIHFVSYVCNIQGGPVESQSPLPWNLIGYIITADNLCYRPAVFFRHIRLTAVLFLQGKFGSLFINVSISVLFFLFF
jgi:hypothetical protein